LPSNPSLTGRLGGLSTRALHDPLEYTKAARKSGPGQLSYWLRKVDPGEELSEDERERRAVAAKRAYYLRLALLSAQVRRRTVPPETEAVEPAPPASLPRKSVARAGPRRAA
jgi:hypothetical protein